MNAWEFLNANIWKMIFVALPMVFSLLYLTILGTFLLIKSQKLFVSTKWIQVKPEDPKLPLLDYIVRDKLVYGQLHLLREHFSAHVACVISLHNGGKFNNGLSVQKWTLTHDCAADGHITFYNKGLKFKEQLVSQSEWIVECISKDEFFFSVDTMDESSAWRREFVRNAIQHGFLRLVETDDNPELVIGLFFRNEKTESDLRLNKHIIREYSDRISSILKTGAEPSWQLN
ncbi:hypothetical protein [Leptospira bandrabouensis]|uniref:hypothetical protein n=1 Tax=Leptospira bandrabouensis TaxID=2484903 RepID=UPI00109174BF|nr:hypothetical protein [Leptospira bandrabouensis]TGN08616.1 hypothetical protein EHR07_03610 [Leptospira bandrabouensis]